MKKILEIRTELLIKQADNTALSHLLSEVQSNLNNVQKDVINYRLRMVLLGSFFLLLAVGIISISKIPGFEEIEATQMIVDIFPVFKNLNNIIICLIPLLFAASYHFFIINLLYRSQLRFLHGRLYQSLYPDLYNQNLHLYTIPHSPGHILKVLHRITQKEKQGSIQPKGLIKAFRNLGIYCEVGFHWLFLVAALIYLFLGFLKECKETNSDCDNTLILASVISIICIFIFAYTLRVAWQYNNYFGHFNQKAKVFESNQQSET